MRRIRVLVSLLLLLGAAAALVAQPVEPAWLVTERGGRFLSSGEFGLAIRSYRLALELAPNDAAALYGLGRAYKAIGDLAVAEDYLERALVYRESFAVPGTELLVRYERADIHRIRRDFSRYEEELFTIVAEDPIPDEALPDSVQRVLSDQGLDRLLVLYRLAESGSTRARGALAELLVGLGRYNTAAEHASVAVLQTMTTLIDAVRRRDPTYEFVTVVDLVARGRHYPEVVAYLERTSLFHDLYFLAAAFWGERNIRAIALWQTLALIDPDGGWGERAGRQTANPRIEPLLVPTR